VSKARLTFHRTFHSVAHSRNFRLFFFGQMVSVTGTWMQSVALAWLVWSLTHSGLAIGVQTALSFGPMLFLGPLGGLVADRRDKRLILIGTQSAFAVLALILGVLVATHVVTLWMVYVISLGQGFVTVLDMPGRQSFYAEMVGQDDLTNAVSLNSAVVTGARMVGPVLAAVLIATIGLAPAFLYNGVSYLALIGGLVAMRPRELYRTGTSEVRKGQVREGLAYAWHTPELRLPLLWMCVVFTFSFNFSVLFPLLAVRVFHGGEAELAALFSVMGAGSMIGALAMARLQDATPRRLAIAASVFGLFSVAAAIAPTFPLEIVALIAMGAASMVFMITGNSTLQLTSRPDMRGRVMALYGMVLLGGTPIGGPVAGWLADVFGRRISPASGTRISVAIGGVVAVAVGIVGVWTLVRLGMAQRFQPRLGRRRKVVSVPVAPDANDPELGTGEGLTA
jgi:MFS family permease